MHALHRKFLALLLSLMLGWLPLQGAFAEVTFMPMQENMMGASVNVPMSHEQASDMSSDCDQCEQDNCCSGGSSCDIHQCASCVFSAVLTESTVMLPLTTTVPVPAFEPSVRSFLFSSLYRPPRV